MLNFWKAPFIILTCLQISSVSSWFYVVNTFIKTSLLFTCSVNTILSISRTISLSFYVSTYLEYLCIDSLLLCNISILNMGDHDSLQLSTFTAIEEEDRYYKTVWYPFFNSFCMSGLFPITFISPPTGFLQWPLLNRTTLFENLTALLQPMPKESLQWIPLPNQLIKSMPLPVPVKFSADFPISSVLFHQAQNVRHLKFHLLQHTLWARNKSCHRNCCSQYDW